MINLSKTHSVFLFYFIFSYASVQAQHANVLYKLVNLPHAGDSIVKQQVDYIDPGISGSNISWDFKSVKRIDDHYTLKYRNQTTDTSLIEGIEHMTIYRFKISGDSLFHTGYENSSTYMKYTKPELRIKFPFRLGDTISSDFVGDGEYCHMIKLHVAGQTTVTADAIGTLSTPLGLTFRNALRVRSLREYSQTGIDSITMSLECYAWYVPKYRYPIFETIKTSTKKIGQKAVDHKVASFFYPPNEQAKLLLDTTNWTMTYSKELPKTIDDLFTNCRLMPNPVQSQLIIDYDLIEDAKVSFTLCDNIGRTKLTLPPIYKSAGHHQETLNLNGFTSGIYPIYVRVNDLVKTIKIIKR